MTYANDRTIYDADSHLMELPDFLSRNADQKTKPLLVGSFDATTYENLDRHPEEYADKLASLGDALTKGPKWHAALGAFNGPERSRALNLLGFKRKIITPRCAPA